MGVSRYLVCGGENSHGENMSRSRIFSVSLSAEVASMVVPHTWGDREEHFPRGDCFIQRHAFPVSGELLTEEFVR